MNQEIAKSTEQAILEVATKLFVEKGFASTSTTEIAKEVGCNQAAVHYYYRTKDKLFGAIFEKKFKFFISKFLKVSDEDIPFEEKLVKKIETHFELLQKNPKIPLFLVNEVITNPKRLESMKETLGALPQMVIGKFQKELDVEIEKGTIRNMSAFDLLFTIISLNVSLFLIGPLFKVISNLSDKEFEKLIESRKQEHIHIILSSIRP